MFLHNNDLWHQVLISKYLKNHSIVIWLRKKNFSIRKVSMIWKGFILILPWIGKYLAWQVGNGMDIQLGIDLIFGIQHCPVLPYDFRDYLKDLGISSLSQAHNILPGQHPYWYTVEDLNITGIGKSFGRNLRAIWKELISNSIHALTDWYGTITMLMVLLLQT